MNRVVRTSILVLAVLWMAIPDGAEASPTSEFPSPLVGPGVAEIKKSQHKKIERGWRELVAGDIKESKRRTAKAGPVPPAQLLTYQIRLVEGMDDPADDLASFCEQYPGYAAAWVTLSVAAEKSGAESAALNAAKRATELGISPPWAVRAEELYQRWVSDRIDHARELFNAGDSKTAMSELSAAEALDPDRGDAVLLEAEIHVADDRYADAEQLLKSISEQPDARFLLGRIAEDRGQWQLAMDRYSSLPVRYPGREPALQRAKTRWRLDLLPGYARTSISAQELTRGDLAVVVVSIRPRLETLPGGRVPVMSDIVDHPGQREIITVVRLGIMNADQRGQVFYPDSPVEISTVKEAIQRSRALLGLTAPVWCAQLDVVGSACISIPSPPSGGAVANAVIDSMSGAIHE